MSTPADLFTDLVAASADDAYLQQLHRRLSTGAQAQDLLDVAYRTLDTPIGALLLAATPAGLVRVAFASEGLDAVLQELSDAISPRVLHDARRLDDVAREFEEYFERRRQVFDVPLDWQLAQGFRRTVLAQLASDVGYGHTASYAALASLAGNPRAVRAVGTACAVNPLPVIVPCHRVVRSDGKLGNYRGGPEAKRMLLAMEASA